MHSPRAAALRLIVLATIAIAGCSPAATQAPATSRPSVAAPAATSTAASSGPGSVTGDCGEGTAALIRQRLAARTDIVSVTTQGGCHDALIITTLAVTDVAKGLAICDSAAEIAYASGEISSITVLAADSKELSIGIKDNPCIGEP
ncbi:MAG: hypothetical protein HYX55_09425 [Chloroflexi bacterium]|nr:hypothetical protein [Chloroflexota bacterium]